MKEVFFQTKLQLLLFNVIIRNLAQWNSKLLPLFRLNLLSHSAQFKPDKVFPTIFYTLSSSLSWSTSLVMPKCFWDANFFLFILLFYIASALETNRAVIFHVIIFHLISNMNKMSGDNLQINSKVWMFVYYSITPKWVYHGIDYLSP